MMTWTKTLGWVAPLALGLVAYSGDALACGGCFVPPDENSQVTGHRMVMSIGMDQSTLYDQIEYSGSPESFAWVLPTKGQVDIGVSSDLIFNQLGFDSAVTVAAPPLDCPGYYCGYGPEAGSTGSATSGGGFDNGDGVDVIAQEVVGPYETVQLAATDPEALQVWLKDHGYNLPKDIEPLVGTYVKEGFNFLAVKLVPGEGVQSMQPIRITTKGSAVALPLRMVAAGTGALTTITLYVLGEGRWETKNFPGFSVNPEDVIWNYDLDRSNYTDLRSDGYAASSGVGWLTESSRPYSVFGFRSQIENVLSFVGPEQSGYGADYQAAYDAMQEDLKALFAGMDENSVWLTRLRAELPREALGNDLVLQAASSQTEVANFIQTTKFIGPQPSCPPVPPGCAELGAGPDRLDPSEGIIPSGGAGCTVGTSGLTDAAFGGAVLLAGLALYRRRRTS